MVKNRLEGKDNLTPWQKYLEKKKEKRNLKKKRKVMSAVVRCWGSCCLFVLLKSQLLFCIKKRKKKSYIMYSTVLRFECGVVAHLERLECLMKSAELWDVQRNTDTMSLICLISNMSLFNAVMSFFNTLMSFCHSMFVGKVVRIHSGCNFRPFQPKIKRVLVAETAKNG